MLASAVDYTYLVRKIVGIWMEDNSMYSCDIAMKCYTLDLETHL